MRTAIVRRAARTAAVGALAVAAAVSGTTIATARDEAPDPVDVFVDASGVHAPHNAPAGLTAFHVTTDVPGGRLVEAFRPHTGVTLDQTLADLTSAVNMTSPSVAAAGISALRADADLFGGASVTPSVPETVTTPITAGRVYLIDFTAFLADPTHPVVTSLDLCGGDADDHGDLADFPDSIVITQETAAGPRFDVNGLTRADSAVLVHNAADEIHEMMIQPVVPGTTDAQITAAFNGQGAPPFTGPALGLGPISPGRSALLQTRHLPPGTYVLLCFVPDDVTGIPHAFLGMHQVVVLT